MSFSKPVSANHNDNPKPESANTSGMSVPAPTDVQNVVARRVDQKDLLTGVDTRSQAAPAKLPPQPAVRAENNDAKGA
jgi:hypothetical protein